MPNPFFSGRIPKDLDERVKQHIAETGESKTDILVHALAAYLNYPVATRNNSAPEVSKEMFVALKETVATLEKRLAILEKPSEPFTNSLISGDNSSNKLEEEKYEESVISLDNKIDTHDNKDIEADSAIISNNTNEDIVITSNPNDNENALDNSSDNIEVQEDDKSNESTIAPKFELLTSVELRQLTGITQAQVDGHKRKVKQKYRKLGLTLEEGKLLEAPEKIDVKNPILVKDHPYNLFYAGQNNKRKGLWNLLPLDNFYYQQLSTFGKQQ